MPNFATAIRTNKIPVVGLVPEASATAPASPVAGQLWNDTSVSPRVVRVFDGTAWTPLNLYAGNTAGSYAAGNDARIVGAAQTANNLADLANVTTARSNLGLGTAAVANTGTGAANVILGNDARLTDQRVPTDNSVTAAKIVDGSITDIEIAAANKDGAVGTPSLRTLGLGAAQAMPGNTTLNNIPLATADVNFNNFRGINVAAPVNAGDIARLADVQSAAAGIDNKPSARLATTANITLAGLQTIDGVAVAAGDRVLVKNQTDAVQNGIYVAAGVAAETTPTPWSRASDTLTANSFWMVEEGNTNDNTQWMISNNGTITVGTTPITIAQFGAATAYTGGTGIDVTGTTISIAGNYAGQASITTLGTVATGTWNAGVIGLAYGGTGAVDAAAARTNLGAAQRGFAADAPALTAGTAVTITHNLGTQDVGVFIKENANQTAIQLDWSTPTANTISIVSDIAFAAAALRVVIVPAV